MKVLYYFLKMLLLGLGYLFPRSSRKIALGAWVGKSYSSNSRYFFERLFDNPEWRIVWVGDEEVRATLPRLPPNACFCRKDGFRAVWHLLTAKTWCFTHATTDLTNLPIWGRSLLIDFGHGATCFKRLGIECPSYRPPQRSNGMIDRLHRLLLRKGIVQGVSSRLGEELTVRSYPGMFIEPCLPFGSPEMDYLIQNKNDVALRNSLRQKISDLCGIPFDKKWIVYAPTFRWTNDENFSFRTLAGEQRREFDELLDRNNAIVIEKLHPRVIKTADGSRLDDYHIYSLSGSRALALEPQHLWIASDMVISDYSSLMANFFIVGKPCIHFAYDLDYYMTQDAGLVDDLENIKLGRIVKTMPELMSALEKIFTGRENGEVNVGSQMEYEKGIACECYLRFIRDFHAGNVNLKNIRKWLDENRRCLP